MNTIEIINDIEKLKPKSISPFKSHVLKIDTNRNKSILVMAKNKKYGIFVYTHRLSDYFNKWKWDRNTKTLYVSIKPEKQKDFLGINGENYVFLQKIYRNDGLNIELI